MSVLDFNIFHAVQERMKNKFETLVKYYLEDGQKYLDEINDNLSNGNIEAVIASAHTLKSSSGILGVIQVQKHAETLEYAAKDLHASNIHDHEQLLPLYKAVKEAFIEAQSVISSEIMNYSAFD